MIDHGVSYSGHASSYAIIGSLSQAKTSDIRDCDNRRAVRNSRMAAEIKTTQPEAIEILRKLDDAGLRQRDLAAALNLDENKISKVRSGERQMKAGEVIAAFEWLEAQGRNSVRARQNQFRVAPDQPIHPPEQDYVKVEVLPTFAGMGGGGTGDGDVETALVPRALVEDMLKGRADDFLLINVRGDSMEPDFHHGDQLLVDKRDTSPAQPGPFALWDGDWGEYVVKNVERARSGEVRIFSSNGKYSAESAPSETTRIIGRPVWFGRRL